MTRISTPLRNTVVFGVFAVSTFAYAAGAKAGDMSPVTTWTHQATNIVQENMQYPRMAELKGLSGTTYLRVTIDRDGNITNHYLSQSSGHSLLDREASKTIEKIGHFPVTSFTDDTSTTFTLGLNYHFAKSWSEKVSINRKLQRQGYVYSDDTASISNGPIFASIEFVPIEEG